ncbi:acyl-CoA N-acyltransferase [Cokeromyces recurvatus]|uniref:acyl-CoA N-acyltransferase n=1 Tax=Cokeromyces recurvatus TaxID=90255 RepID=UPI00221EBE3E|nr:acyl-CoA N-acyltransferase [Cokeromyces recurvatus]KAI7901959.1 acyl-CoA N-acyltransferase [Cokeromyces recurvatus]
MKIINTPATLDDLDIIHQYEEASYHPDEAASRKQLENRIIYASKSGPELFTVARDMDSDDQKVIAFLCTTLTNADLVTDESMSVHEPNGKTICLHSVCVSPDYRHKGIGTKLLSTWIKELKDINKANGNGQGKKYNRIALLSRPKLVSFYENVGFKKIGTSEVVHGPEPWIDCILDL